MKIVGKVIKYVLIAALAAVIGFLLWRIWYFNHDSRLDTVIPTDAALAEYAKGDAANVLENPVHDKLSSTGGTGDGYFSGYGFVYFPDEKEVQVTIRMNKSTLDALGVEEMPELFLKIYNNFSYEDEDPDVTLRYCERKEDDSFLMYRYRRLVFGDVEIGPDNDLLVCMSTDGGDSELVVHFREQELEKYEFTRADKKALEAAAGER